MAMAMMLMKLDRAKNSFMGGVASFYMGVWIVEK
jgi:hypothetical protein